MLVTLNAPIIDIYITIDNRKNVYNEIKWGEYMRKVSLSLKKHRLTMHHGLLFSIGRESGLSPDFKYIKNCVSPNKRISYKTFVQINSNCTKYELFIYFINGFNLFISFIIFVLNSYLGTFL